MALRFQVNGRIQGMEGLISGLGALTGALNCYGMVIGSPTIAAVSRIKVLTIGGLQLV
jgi:hypothetical protein